ncbi:hypothetical protein KR52_06250 [Synechococcus sp. KORDI-52]|nr:hypothetical protein KR52_06250 [Synechococcus sp. KORDI-52]
MVVEVHLPARMQLIRIMLMLGIETFQHLVVRLLVLMSTRLFPSLT